MTPTNTGETIAAMPVQLYDQAIWVALNPSLSRYCHSGTNHAPQMNHSMNIMVDSLRFSGLMTFSLSYLYT